MIAKVIDILEKIVNAPSAITANRLSIVNGKDDITEFGTLITGNEKLLLDNIFE